MTIKDSIFGALKQNLLPGLVLQCFAFAILLLYFFVPWSQSFFIWLSELKQSYGYVYSGLATSLFGGVIPFFVMLFTKRFDAARNLWPLFLFYSLFWIYKGVEVDYFYRAQASWFGSDHQLATIASKMAVDQFIYSPFWAVPSIAIPYLWAECGFKFSALAAALNREFFLQKIPTLIVSSWMVWTPAVCIIYAMPDPLQMPIQNLVLCFWALMLAVLNKKSAQS